MSFFSQRNDSSKTRQILPGFRLSLGYTVFYLSLVALIPLSMLFFNASKLGWDTYWEVITSERIVAAFKVNLYTAAAAALLNAFFGFIVAWVQVRYDYFGKKFVDALIDIPFALPTSVAGIALTAAFGRSGPLGGFLESIGIKVAYTPLGIIVALLFIGLPFVIRTVEPVLHDLEYELEEASETLGANRWQTFSKIIFPLVFPSVLTGAALAFARGLGEYGSVVFISGNLPLKTEIVSLLIVSKLEQYEYQAATAIAVTMLVFSFLILFFINLFQWWARKRINQE